MKKKEISKTDNLADISKQKIKDAWQAMPRLMKVLAALNIYSLILSIINLLGRVPISFSYFDTPFPKNFPGIWYLYQISFIIWNLAVFVWRSRKELMRYIWVTIIIMTIGVANSVYFIIRLPQSEIGIAILINLVSLIVPVLVIIYLIRQKTFFSNP
jgi:hypothetical protein